MDRYWPLRSSDVVTCAADPHPKSCSRRTHLYPHSRSSPPHRSKQSCRFMKHTWGRSPVNVWWGSVQIRRLTPPQLRVLIKVPQSFHVYRLFWYFSWNTDLFWSEFSNQQPERDLQSEQRPPDTQPGTPGSAGSGSGTSSGPSPCLSLPRVVLDPDGFWDEADSKPAGLTRWGPHGQEPALSYCGWRHTAYGGAEPQPPGGGSPGSWRTSWHGPCTSCRSSSSFNGCGCSWLELWRWLPVF